MKYNREYLIRMDDYPTGVKPVLENRLHWFDKILSEIEKREIPYVLGVVPALIDYEDIEFLKKLKFAKIALHGYDHNFHVWNGKNSMEFKGESEDEILHKMQNGLLILHDFNVKHYICPFNEINVETKNVLKNLGIEIVGKVDKFYAESWKIVHKIHEFDFKKDFITLHLTWEILNEDKQFKSLIMILDHLAHGQK